MNPTHSGWPHSPAVPSAKCSGAPKTVGSEAEAVVEALGPGVGPARPCEGGSGAVSCLGDVGHGGPITAIAAPAATPATTAGTFLRQLA